MLHFSSFLLGFISFYALLHDEYLLGFLFMMLYGTSLLHHAHYTTGEYLGGKTIGKLDKALCKLIWVIMFLKTMSLPTCRLETKIIWVCLFYIPFIYYLCLPNRYYTAEEGLSLAVGLHVSIHVATAIGMILYISQSVFLSPKK